MVLEGLNPYLSLPESFIQQGINPIAEASVLYNGMGEMNGSHYTNYPPLNQLCFLIGSNLCKDKYSMVYSCITIANYFS